MSVISRKFDRIAQPWKWKMGSQNPRISSLTKLMTALKQSRTPFETLRTIRQGFGEAYGSLASMMISTRGLADGEYRLIQLRREGDYAGDSDPWLQEQFPLYRGGLVATIIEKRRRILSTTSIGPSIPTFTRSSRDTDQSWRFLSTETVCP